MFWKNGMIKAYRSGPEKIFYNPSRATLYDMKNTKKTFNMAMVCERVVCERACMWKDRESKKMSSLY
jgi:hypothetical protein